MLEGRKLVEVKEGQDEDGEVVEGRNWEEEEYRVECDEEGEG